jgi:DNA-binding transcriptional LysR family regulator
VELSPGLLTRLRAFEAVGRHLSFNRAAAELDVTPTALSHHVRRLEHEVGVELFTRLHRRIQLTAAGEAALEDCSRGLELLARAAERAAGSGRATTLNISVAPYFSAKWLIPRLATFWAAYPATQVQLHHAYQPADFLRDDADVGISWGTGSWPHTNAVQIVRGHLTAICSRELRQRMPDNPVAGDLVRWPLFYEFSADHCTRWFEALGAAPPPSTNMVKVDDSYALLNLVLDSQGVGLFFSDLIRDDLRLGHLHRPIAVEIDSGSAYYLTQATDRVMTPQLRTFWDWILDEADLDRPSA